MQTDLQGAMLSSPEALSQLARCKTALLTFKSLLRSCKSSLSTAQELESAKNQLAEAIAAGKAAQKKAAAAETGIQKAILEAEAAAATGADLQARLPALKEATKVPVRHLSTVWHGYMPPMSQLAQHLKTSHAASGPDTVSGVAAASLSLRLVCLLLLKVESGFLAAVI